jgi:hypothetical protein
VARAEIEAARVKLQVAPDARRGDVTELRQAVGRLDRPADPDRVGRGIAVRQA